MQADHRRADSRPDGGVDDSDADRDFCDLLFVEGWHRRYGAGKGGSAQPLTG